MKSELSINRAGSKLANLKVSEIVSLPPMIKDPESSMNILYDAVSKCLYSLGTTDDNQLCVIITEDIYDSYKIESLDLILVALKNGRSGKYGKVYGKLNTIVISEWISKVQEEVAIAREKMIHNKKIARELESERSVADTEKVKEYLKKWKENIAPKNFQLPKPKEEDKNTLGSRVKKNLK